MSERGHGPERCGRDMALVTLVPLTEAAAFTAGRAALPTRRLDAERVAIALVSVVAILALVLMVRLIPVDPAPEMPGPDEVSTILG